MFCSSITIQTDYDHTVNFNQLKQYQWLQRDQEMPAAGYEAIESSFIESKVKESVELTLQKRGYQERIEGEPDFYITYYTGLKGKLDVNDYGYDYGRWQSGLVDRYVTVDAVQEGLLMIDIISAEQRELIWRGWATGIIEDPKTAGQKIVNAVQKILEKFPPGNTN